MPDGRVHTAITVTVRDMSDDDVAGLRDRLTQAYLAGDGAEVVRIMELIAQAEAKTPEQPPRQHAA